MRAALKLRTQVQLPPGEMGGFDHGDVDSVTGRVFVAHTAFGTVEVIDGDALAPIGRLDGCPEGSGVLCAGPERLVFAAARGAGKVLIIDTDQLRVLREAVVGPRPNGLAWDGTRGHLLVADVDPLDQAARIVDAASGQVVAVTRLPGRPRWCVYDADADRFLVNIREPAAVAVLAAGSGAIQDTWPISSPGPHGIDIDQAGRRAFVACDGGDVIVIDLALGRESGRAAITGEPDAIWFNAQKQRLYVAVGNPGQIDVLDTERLALAESISTEPGAKTTAFDPDRQRLYVFMPRACAAAIFEEA